MCSAVQCLTLCSFCHKFQTKIIKWKKNQQTLVKLTQNESNVIQSMAHWQLRFRVRKLACEDQLRRNSWTQSFFLFFLLLNDFKCVCNCDFRMEKCVKCELRKIYIGTNSCYSSSSNHRLIKPRLFTIYIEINSEKREHVALRFISMIFLVHFAVYRW